ncbi:hypothetical protein HELRODRAFT_189841 [Helobdella robusta]|uniref:Uncharacterized protein n=1 Tax=Helobdella robusta TaxID=6412 RepID=T1FRE9_HELRO|nr:hypothetical protein HELRODRAFT_189841 [Helobdella robusta]ESN90352.1 hypothetical protein HELRODRAFT_189841 [Helobdella robusta]
MTSNRHWPLVFLTYGDYTVEKTENRLRNHERVDEVNESAEHPKRTYDGLVASVDLVVALATVALVSTLTPYITLQSLQDAYEDFVIPEIILILLMICGLIFIFFFVRSKDALDAQSYERLTRKRKFDACGGADRILFVAGLVLFYTLSFVMDFVHLMAKVDCSPVWMACKYNVKVTFIVDVIFHITRIVFFGCSTFFAIVYRSFIFASKCWVRYSLAVLFGVNLALWFDVLLHESARIINNSSSSAIIDNEIIIIRCLQRNDSTDMQSHNFTIQCFGEETNIFKFLNVSVVPLCYPFMYESCVLLCERFMHWFCHCKRMSVRTSFKRALKQPNQPSVDEETKVEDDNVTNVLGVNENNEITIKSDHLSEPINENNGSFYLVDSSNDECELDNKEFSSAEDENELEDEEVITDESDLDDHSFHDISDINQEANNNNDTSSKNINQQVYVKSCIHSEVSREKMDFHSRADNSNTAEAQNSSCSEMFDSATRDNSQQIIVADNEEANNESRRNDGQLTGKHSKRRLSKNISDSDRKMVGSLGCALFFLFTISTNVLFFIFSLLPGAIQKNDLSAEVKHDVINRLFLYYTIPFYGSIIISVIYGFTVAKDFPLRRSNIINTFQGLDYLLFISASGPFAYNVFSLVAAYNKPSILVLYGMNAIGSVVVQVVNILQVYIQIPFCFFAGRVSAVHPNGKKRPKSMHFQAVLVHVSVSNATLWLVNSFATTYNNGSVYYDSEFFGKDLWNIINSFILPITLFFRFNSFLVVLKALRIAFHKGGNDIRHGHY